MLHIERPSLALAGQLIDAGANQIIVDEVRSVVHDLEQESWPHTPSPILSAVYQAGRLLRHDPCIRLADTTVAAPEELLRDKSNKALVDIVNGSVQRCGNAPLAFRCLSKKAVAACLGAESAHFSTIRGLAAKSAGDRFPYFADLVVAGGMAAMIKKTNNARPSCLTLRDLTIDGVPYPAGSLCRLDFKDGSTPEKRQMDQGYSSRRFDIYKPEDVASLGFVRLTAWALDISELAKINWEPIDWQFSIKGLVRRKKVENIAQIRELVSTIIDNSIAAQYLQTTSSAF